MGLVKKKEGSVKDAVKTIQAARTEENGTDAAIARLKTADSVVKSLAKTVKSKYKQNDPDKVALGKTRCVQFQSALESPAIAGMQFNTMGEYLELVKQAANAGVAYSFQED